MAHERKLVGILLDVSEHYSVPLEKKRNNDGKFFEKNNFLLYLSIHKGVKRDSREDDKSAGGFCVMVFDAEPCHNVR